MIVRNDPAERDSRIVRSCRPIRMNSRPLSRNLVSSHVATDCSRVLADTMRGSFQPIQSPAVTTAKTPETWSASAGR